MLFGRFTCEVTVSVKIIMRVCLGRITWFFRGTEGGGVSRHLQGIKGKEGGRL